ncbi:hypothetical protein AX774_g7846 [Zancudomyces culisetae]|uniref:BHLH domain-containing protein n=1 Tax=Zancudomyces culisetae TaxID=1213189 RepID=A0A1R1PCR8_ZANCU|nr:hypothetical protein AX774_g7846 [Zancudomyces culisetae]|eukprot:OMH78758.1 hypothetical protein AX774_g7846 [Zancudomyces culisetae]
MNWQNLQDGGDLGSRGLQPGQGSGTDILEALFRFSGLEYMVGDSRGVKNRIAKPPSPPIDLNPVSLFDRGADLEEFKMNNRQCNSSVNGINSNVDKNTAEKEAEMLFEMCKTYNNKIMTEKGGLFNNNEEEYLKGFLDNLETDMFDFNSSKVGLGGDHTGLKNSYPGDGVVSASNRSGQMGLYKNSILSEGQKVNKALSTGYETLLESRNNQFGNVNAFDSNIMGLDLDTKSRFGLADIVSTKNIDSVELPRFNELGGKSLKVVDWIANNQEYINQNSGLASSNHSDNHNHNHNHNHNNGHDHGHNQAMSASSGVFDLSSGAKNNAEIPILHTLARTMLSIDKTRSRLTSKRSKKQAAMDISRPMATQTILTEHKPSMLNFNDVSMTNRLEPMVVPRVTTHQNKPSKRKSSLTLSPSKRQKISAPPTQASSIAFQYPISSSSNNNSNNTGSNHSNNIRNNTASSIASSMAAHYDIQSGRGVVDSTSSTPPLINSTNSSRPTKSREILSKDEKRINHIASERRRRGLIKQSFSELTSIVYDPSTRKVENSRRTKPSKSTIIMCAVEYINNIKSEIDMLKSKLDSM